MGSRGRIAGMEFSEVSPGREMQEEIVDERVSFPSEQGALEGVLAYPGAAIPSTSLLLLNPHPQLGGNMDNNVIRHVARRAAECGCLTLRFNYRGVGQSAIHLPDATSAYDYWATLECERRYEEIMPDISAAAEFLDSVLPQRQERVLLGYSLGAILAGIAWERLGKPLIIAVSPPTAQVKLTAYHRCTSPKLFVTGESDFAFDENRFQVDFENIPQPKTRVTMRGCDHFFRKEEEKLFQFVKPFLEHEVP